MMVRNNMARYTYSETVHVPQGHLHKGVTEFLNSCDYDVIYLKSDYIMARETVGRVPFARLAFL